MKTVYMVSTNKGKVALLGRELAKRGVQIKHLNLNLPEIQDYDVAAVASEKVMEAYERTGKQCLVQDSGLFVHALKGFPGALTHPVLDTIGIEGILKLTEGSDRLCEFLGCIAYYDGKLKRPKLFMSAARGSLSYKPMGPSEPHHWSRLFEIFIPDGRSKTLAQMGKEEYLRWHVDSGIDLYIGDFAGWYLKRK